MTEVIRSSLYIAATMVSVNPVVARKKDVVTVVPDDSSPRFGVLVVGSSDSMVVNFVAFDNAYTVRLDLSFHRARRRTQNLVLESLQVQLISGSHGVVSGRSHDVMVECCCDVNV
jgi:hypothetical protein